MFCRVTYKTSFRVLWYYRAGEQVGIEVLQSIYTPDYVSVGGQTSHWQ
jgi:hypothetical protein